MRWKLDVDSRLSSFDFFASYPWVPGQHQVGHEERIDMVYRAAKHIVKSNRIDSISDIGCGDGSLLQKTQRFGLKQWGYDAGLENVAVAKRHGLYVKQANILTDNLTYGDLSICSEVLEHLLEPEALLRRIESPYLIASSPSAENPRWHYLEHLWAFDLEGYKELLESCNWRVIDQREVTATGTVDFFDNGDSRHPRFQMVLAKSRKYE